MRKLRGDVLMQALQFVDVDNKTSTYISQVPRSASRRTEDKCRTSHVSKGSLVPKASGARPHGRSRSSSSATRSHRSAAATEQVFPRAITSRASKTSLLQTMNLPTSDGSECCDPTPFCLSCL